MKYYEIGITTRYTKNGKYLTLPDTTQAYDSVDELLDTTCKSVSKVYKIDEDSLPKGLKNICGQIHNEPDIVYGYIDKWGDAHYFGVLRI